MGLVLFNARWFCGLVASPGINPSGAGLQSCTHLLLNFAITLAQEGSAEMPTPHFCAWGIDYGLKKSGIDLLNTKQFPILEANKYDYMKAISDINGFDIKVHSNGTIKLFECLYAWFSETLKIYKQDPPLKTFNEFFDFNTSLFEEKKKGFGSDELAKNYIEKLSIREYIQAIQERL